MIEINIAGVKFKHIEAIIFDKDGTLEDSQNFLRELGHKRARIIDAQIPGIGEPLLMAFGIQDDTLDPTGLMAVGSQWENTIAAAAYIAETGRSWFESVTIARNAFIEAQSYLQNRSQASPLFAGSLEVVKLLADAGLRLGILSADSTAGVEAFVDRHQLSNYFQLGMGVEEQGPTKPDPVLFKQACQFLEVDPDATLMVGDSTGDINMAKAAGAAGTIGICWGKRKPQAAHLSQADIIISQLDEIQVIKL